MRAGLVALVAAAVAVGGPARAYEVNGKQWPSMPVSVWVNAASAPEMSGGTPMGVVEDATKLWADVGCSEASFVVEGDTGATWAKDGKNTVFWVTEDWVFDENAAGATLWIPAAPGEPMEVDLALNAVSYQWVVGGADALTSDVVDPTSVIAHELGHWLGLAHSPDTHATMYQAMLPNAVQASLAADDKWGICSLYPSGEQECQDEGDCPAGELCEAQGGVAVCAEQRAPVGAPCSKDDLNCEGMCFISLFECETICAFTTLDYSEGFCAPLCTGGGECPEGWTCTEFASAGAEVCMPDEDEPVEAEPDVAEPVEAEPAIAEPLVAEPAAAEPAQDAGGQAEAEALVAEEVAPDAVAGDQPDAGAEPGAASGHDGGPLSPETSAAQAPGDAVTGADAAAAASGGGGGCEAARARPESSSWLLGALALWLIVLARRGGRAT